MSRGRLSAIVPRVTARARWSAAWPHLRAALVAFHLLAIVLSAIPAPAGGMNRKNWADPTVQGEFEAWGRRLGIDADRLEDALWSLARTWMGFRELYLTPVRPYLELTGTDQPWRMFVAPHRYPARYQVQVRAADAGADDWETVFEERSPTAQWRASFFAQERVRSALFRYSWPEYSHDARRFCDHLGRRLFEERPGAEWVRCRYWKAKSPSPEEARRGAMPDGTWVASKMVRRTKPGEPAPTLRLVPRRPADGGEAP